MNHKSGLQWQTEKELPSLGATSGCWEIFFRFLQQPQTTRLDLDLREVHCSTAFYRNHSSTSFLPVLILLLAGPTAWFPLIWDTFLWIPNQQTPDGTAVSFPSLNHPQVLLKITHVTCPCKKPLTTKKSFITSRMKILSSSEWLFFFFRSKNIFCQLKDVFKRYHLILWSRKNWHKSVPYYSYKTVTSSQKFRFYLKFTKYYKNYLPTGKWLALQIWSTVPQN